MESPDGSFDSLFQALIHQYKNKHLLVDSHISSIINYEKIQQELSRNLCNFNDCINKNIRGLKVLVYNHNQLPEVVFINKILQKIDRNFQVRK